MKLSELILKTIEDETGQKIASKKILKENKHCQDFFKWKYVNKFNKFKGEFVLNHIKIIIKLEDKKEFLITKILESNKVEVSSNLLSVDQSYYIAEKIKNIIKNQKEVLSNINLLTKIEENKELKQVDKKRKI